MQAEGSSDVGTDATTDRFSFTAAMPGLGQGVDRFREALTDVEQLGYSAVAISDHVIGGWTMDPITMLAAAAMATTRLRLRTMVLANDYRHPVLVQRAMATLDTLSRGRVEIGLGAGWWLEEYEALGVPFDPPTIRIRRLEQSVRIIKRLFTNDSVDLDGPDYRIRSVDGTSGSVQQPHPPIFIGGGGPRILALAGREADIAGINPLLPESPHGSSAAILHEDSGVTQLVDVILAEAAAAGRPAPRLQMSLVAYDIERPDGSRARWRSSLAPSSWETIETLPARPGVLSGTTDECVRQLESWREQFGVSEFHVGGDPGSMAAVVAGLAGH